MTVQATPLSLTHLARHASPVGADRARTLHLIDIENLVRGRISTARVQAAWAAYVETVGINHGDQVRISCASGARARLMAFAVPAGPQLLVGGRGPDAADQALISSVDVAFTARRFPAVVIASADHIFAPLASALASAGCEVTAAHATKCAAALARATATQIRVPVNPWVGGIHR